MINEYIFPLYRNSSNNNSANDISEGTVKWDRLDTSKDKWFKVCFKTTLENVSSGGESENGEEDIEET